MISLSYLKKLTLLATMVNLNLLKFFKKVTTEVQRIGIISLILKELIILRYY